MNKPDQTWHNILIFSLSFLCVLLLNTTSMAQDRVMLGVRFQDQTTIINTLVGGGPAEVAGMQLGNVILSVDEAYVLQPLDVTNILRNKKIGETVTLEIKRGDEILFLDLKLIRYVRADDVSGLDRPRKREVRDLGIAGQNAPNWTVEQWVRLPDGKDSLNVNELRGKTVFLLCFQSDCPASRRQAIPLLKRIMTAHEDDPSVVFIAIQTVLDDFEWNSISRAEAIFDELDIDIPIGQDTGGNQGSKTAKSYNLPGTPWVVIIGPDRVVRFNRFFVRTQQAIAMIKAAKAMSDRTPVKINAP